MILPFFRISYISIDKKWVHFRMHIFHGYLKPVKASGFCYLYFLTEPLDEIFIDDAVGSSEESKDMRYKMFFFRFQLLPVVEILPKMQSINFQINK